MNYEAFGALTGANYGNGLRMVQSWGNDGRLANRRLERTATSVRLSSLTHTYDNSDNITQIADTLDASKARSIGYDPVERLTSIATPAGTRAFTAISGLRFRFDPPPPGYGGGEHNPLTNHTVHSVGADQFPKSRENHSETRSLLTAPRTIPSNQFAPRVLTL